MPAMIALYLAQEVAQALFDAAQGAGLTPTAVEDMHITLAALGDSDVLTGREADLNDELTWIARARNPVEATFSGLARLTGETQDSLVALIDAPTLTNLREGVLSALRWAEVPVLQNHTFLPHVTLGALAKEAATPNFVLPDAEMSFTEFSLAVDDERTTYSFIRRVAGVQEMRQQLGQVLEQGIKAKSGDRAAVLQAMAQAANVETRLVEQALAGVWMPNLHHLRGFATALDLTLETLTAVAQPVAELQAPSTRLRLTEQQGETVNNRTKIELTCIVEMRGAYPDVPLPADIDRAALGEEAFFVTLPIGQAGAVSRNNRTYTREAVEMMVEQINTNRPEGMWGHLSEYEMSTRYDPPAIRWLAAMMDRDGIAWGKGLPLTEATREHFRLAKATNARVGTSISAWATMEGDDVIALELLTVDLADPARVGVPMTAAQPMLSSEMATARRSPEATPEFTKPQSGGIMTEQEMLQRIEDVKAEQRDQIRTLTEQSIQKDTQLKEMKRLAELFGSPEDLWMAAKAVIQQRDDLRAENGRLLDGAIKSAVAEKVKVEAHRPLLVEQVRALKPATQAEVEQAVNDVLSRESVKELLRYGVAAEMGPAQQAHNSRQDAAPTAYFTD